MTFFEQSQKGIFKKKNHSRHFYKTGSGEPLVLIHHMLFIAQKMHSYFNGTLIII